MNIVEKRIKLKKFDEKFYLIPLGDIHYGTKCCNIEKLKEIVTWIKETPNTLWFTCGDECDYINIGDPRFDPKTIPPELLKHLDSLPYEQVKQLTKILEPIKNKCLGIGVGDHSETIRLRYHFDVNSQLCNNLRAPSLGWSSFIVLTFDYYGHQRKVVIYFSHGWGGGHYIGGKVNKLISIAKDFQADIYVFGHLHDKFGYVKEQLMVSNKNHNIITRKQAFVLAGTFYQTYIQGDVNYAEKKTYPPNVSGVVKIVIRPFRHKRYEGRWTDIPSDIHISE